MGGVQDDRARGRVVRPGGLGVGGVAPGDVGRGGGDVGAVLAGTAAGAFDRVGGQVDLEVGIGRDDLADVAAFDDDPLLGGLDDVALRGDQELPDLRNGGDGGHVGGDLVAADVGVDVAGVEPGVAVGRSGAELHLGGLHDLDHGLLVTEVDPGAQHGQGGGAVHGTGVEAGGTQFGGEPARYARFTGT